MRFPAGKIGCFLYFPPNPIVLRSAAVFGGEMHRRLLFRAFCGILFVAM